MSNQTSDRDHFTDHLLRDRLFAVITILGALLIVWVGVNDYRHYVTKQVTLEANRNMDGMIRLAKAETSDPCNPAIFRVVEPPPGSDRQRVFVVAGVEVSTANDDNWRLRPILSPPEEYTGGNVTYLDTPTPFGQIKLGVRIEHGDESPHGRLHLGGPFVTKNVATAYCGHLSAKSAN